MRTKRPGIVAQKKLSSALRARKKKPEPQSNWLTRLYAWFLSCLGRA